MPQAHHININQQLKISDHFNHLTKIFACSCVTDTAQGQKNNATVCISETSQSTVKHQNLDLRKTDQKAIRPANFRNSAKIFMQ